MNQSVKSTPDDAKFLDANILLEIILGRKKEHVARRFIKRHQDNLYISALTGHLVVHFGQAIVELPVLRKFLTDYTMLSMEPTDFEWAFSNSRNRDFEDALQLAIAIRNGCRQFITFDKDLAGLYKDLVVIETVLLS